MTKVKLTFLLLMVISMLLSMACKKEEKQPLLFCNVKFEVRSTDTCLIFWGGKHITYGIDNVIYDTVVPLDFKFVMTGIDVGYHKFTLQVQSGFATHNTLIINHTTCNHVRYYQIKHSCAYKYTELMPYFECLLPCENSKSLNIPNNQLMTDTIH